VSDAKYLCAAAALSGWRDDILKCRPPVRYTAGKGELAGLEVGPGLVTLLGGAPGAGKTALTMQLVLDALRLTHDLMALVANVEMPPGVLLDRQLARLSGIDAGLIRHRRLGPEHAERIEQALHTLQPLADRLAFLRLPFTLANVAAAADAFGARLLLLDYIQRFRLGDRDHGGEPCDQRSSVNVTMDYIRRFADLGFAVIVVSAVGRTKDRRGRSSFAGDGLNLASFRESSELEFGCDDAFILTPDGDDQGDAVTLRHLKSRHGEARDISLTFDRRHQRFTPAGADQAARPDTGKVQSELAALWGRIAPVTNDAGGSNHDE
jgi:replicative DNA helicase